MQPPEKPPHPFLRNTFHQNVGKRRCSLSVGRCSCLDPVHKVQRDVCVLRERVDMVVEVRRTRCGDADLLGRRFPFR